MSTRTLLPAVMIWAGVALVLSLVGTNIAGAQELTPRSFWPAPTKTEILIFGYTYSTGGVVVDPTITFHELRHNAASLLLGEGIHPAIARTPRPCPDEHDIGY